MAGLPEGADIELKFGVPIEDPPGPARPAPHRLQGANLNVITDVKAFFAGREAEPEAAVTDPVIAAFMEDPLWYRKPEVEPEPMLAEAPAPLTGTDALIAAWMDPEWTASPGEAVAMSQEEVDEVFVPGTYEVVPFGLRRVDAEDQKGYEAAKYKRSRHRPGRRAGEKLVSDMVVEPIDAEGDVSYAA